MSEKKFKPNEVYNRLKEEILYFDLLPGQAIGEIETASRFHVSRTPLRDAFKRLEYEGLLEIVPHVGTRVTKINLDQIIDIVYMREKLELSVMENLIKTINQADLFKLDYILTKQKKLLSSDTGRNLAKEFIKSDNEFHRTIFEIAGKRNVWNYLMTFEHHYERFRMLLNINSKEKLEKLNKDHYNILGLLSNNEFESLKNTYVKHLYEGIKNAKDIVNENIDYFDGFE